MYRAEFNCYTLHSLVSRPGLINKSYSLGHCASCATHLKLQVLQALQGVTNEGTQCAVPFPPSCCGYKSPKHTKNTIGLMVVFFFFFYIFTIYTVFFSLSLFDKVI